MVTITERTRFTFRLPVELFRRIKTAASKLGLSANSLIVKILWDWLEGQERKADG
jgi:predicted DNA binding CopG/RHH family protein